jgi:hypothetical protein
MLRSTSREPHQAAHRPIQPWLLASCLGDLASAHSSDLHLSIRPATNHLLCDQLPDLGRSESTPLRDAMATVALRIL